MAVKKTASKPKAKDASVPKKTSVKAAAKTETAAKKAAPAPKKAAAPKAAAPKAVAKKAAPKAAAPKKAATPKKAAVTKLTSAQADLLAKIGGAGEAGYLGDKKAEHRTIEALRERKLVKRGAKHKESGHYHYQISNAGKKHVEKSSPAASPTPAPPASGA